MVKKFYMNVDETLEIDYLLEEINDDVIAVESEPTNGSVSIDYINRKSGIINPSEIGPHKINVNGQVVEIQVNSVPESGISHWRFEDSVIDSWGDNNGTDNTSAGYVEGVVGNLAKDFDGVDDGVLIPDLFSTGQSMSVAFWFNADSLGSDDRLMAISEQYEFLANIGRAGNNKVGVRWRGSNGSASDYGFRTVSTGTWYHYAFTFDSESGDIVGYINGTEEFSKSGVGSSPIRERTDGFRNRDGKGHYDGALDDARAYGKRLSQSEVSNLYQTGVISM